MSYFFDFEFLQKSVKFEIMSQILKMVLKPVDRLLELQKFCKQSDFRESVKNIFFYRKINLELPIVSLYSPKNKALRSRNSLKVIKLKMTHAQPTQKFNILFRSVNWLIYKIYKKSGLVKTGKSEGQQIPSLLLNSTLSTRSTLEHFFYFCYLSFLRSNSKITS